MQMFLLNVVASDYGLFLSDEDPRKGIWLESGRTLDYYMLRNGVKASRRLSQHTPCLFLSIYFGGLKALVRKHDDI